MTMPGPVGLVGTAVTRPVFEGIGLTGKAIFYALAALSTTVFAWGLWRRVHKYNMGRAAGRGPMIRAALASRLRAIGKGSSVTSGNRSAGLAHFFIFWGFLAALLATAILTIDTDVVRNLSRLFAGHDDSFFHGTFFIAYTFVIDTAGFAFFLALIYMAVRRGLLRPRQLAYARADAPEGGYSRKSMVAGDWVFLGLLLGILATAYLLTGLRILGQHMPWFSAFSPFGRAVGGDLFRPRHVRGPGGQNPRRYVVGARGPRPQLHRLHPVLQGHAHGPRWREPRRNGPGDGTPVASATARTSRLRGDL